MAASAFGEGPSGFSLKPMRTASSAKPPSGKTGTESRASAALSAGAGSGAASWVPGAVSHPGRAPAVAAPAAVAATALRKARRLGPRPAG